MRLVHLSITIALSVLHAAVLAPMLAANQSPVASGINLAIFIFITSALLMQTYWLIKSEINQMIAPLLDREEERALKAIIDRAALASSTQHMCTALTYSMGANKITTNPAGTTVVNSISIKDLIKHAEVTPTRQCERKTVLVTDNMDLTGLRARLWEKLTEQALPPELMALPPGAEKVFAADLAKPEGDRTVPVAFKRVKERAVDASAPVDGNTRLITLRARQFGNTKLRQQMQAAGVIA